MQEAFNWAVLALTRLSEVELFCGCRSFQLVYFPKGYFLSLTAQPVVSVFVVGKSLGPALVSAVWWNVAFYPLIFEKGVILSAAVACIGEEIAP